MTTTKQKIAGAVIVAAGVVGSIVYPTATDAPVTQPNEVVQSVVAEIDTSVPDEIKTDGGLNLKIKRLKTYKSPDGDLSDTPKAGYTLVTDPAQMITQTTIIETAAEKKARIKAAADDEFLNKIKNDNEAIYRRIGEQITIKNGKLAVDPLADTSVEDAQITNLKAQLK